MCEQQLQALAGDEGLSDRAFRVMARVVIGQTSPQSLTALAGEARCSMASAQKIAAELEGKGLLQREVRHRGKGEGRGRVAAWTFTI